MRSEEIIGVPSLSVAQLVPERLVIFQTLSYRAKRPPVRFGLGQLFG